jgi:hypothetical protein
MGLLSNNSDIYSYILVMKETLQSMLSDRVLMFNAASLTFSFTNIEMLLKLILLTASIVYTVMKIVELYNKKCDNKD